MNAGVLCNFPVDIFRDYGYNAKNGKVVTVGFYTHFH